MANKEIRELMRDLHVKHWQVADVLGVHESTFCKNLRHEYTDAYKAKVIAAIKTVEGFGEEE